jgi:hypothetical protein
MAVAGLPADQLLPVQWVTTTATTNTVGSSGSGGAGLTSPSTTPRKTSGSASTFTTAVANVSGGSEGEKAGRR